MQITYFPPDGSPSSHATGAWEFGYALDGRAVIDVWQVPGRDTLAGAPRSADQECGLCVRIWDAGLQLWRFTFHGTAHGRLIHMYAREIDDEIVMEQAEGGDLVRWIFSDVRPESFHWRSRRSADGGASWRLQQRVRADRAARQPQQVIRIRHDKPSSSDQHGGERAGQQERSEREMRLPGRAPGGDEAHPGDGGEQVPEEQPGSQRAGAEPAQVQA